MYLRSSTQSGKPFCETKNVSFYCSPQPQVPGTKAVQESAELKEQSPQNVTDKTLFSSLMGVALSALPDNTHTHTHTNLFISWK